MLVFEFVLIMLAAVLLSSVINRFIPVLSSPLLQIALGVVIWVIPYGIFNYEFILDPELLLMLFITPIVYHVGYVSDKRLLWSMKGPILGASVVLVFITVLSGGYLVHLFIPVIPLAAAFVFMAALGPTDDVAVDAIIKRVAMPHKIESTLVGESIVNDASAITCFQFALVAMMIGGSFSIAEATLQFVLLGIGGLGIGIILAFLRYIFIKRVLALGLGNVSLNVLFDILTPFIIFLIAENLEVSGILAVFSAGITHSFMRSTYNPATVKQNMAGDSIWKFLIFTLDGLVFVMLGLLLPGIVQALSEDALAMNAFEIAGCIVLITGIIAAVRFFWWFLTVPKKTYQEPGHSISRTRAAAVFSLSGVRGTVTLAIVMSIPYLLADGSAFPERNLIILLVSGVIIFSMFIGSFIVPLLVPRRPDDGQNEEWLSLVPEILQGVIVRLKSEATDENRFAALVVIRNCFRRRTAMYGRDAYHKGIQTERELREEMYLWEKEYVTALLEGKTGESVSQAAAEHYLNTLQKRSKAAAPETVVGSFKRRMNRSVRQVVNPQRRSRADLSENTFQSDFMHVLSLSARHVLRKLGEIKNEENAAVVERIAVEFELMADAKLNPNLSESEAYDTVDDSVFHTVMVRSFSIEREIIQKMFEEGRISRKGARNMRAALDTLETQMPGEH